jgi:hypothetical protein
VLLALPDDATMPPAPPVAPPVIAAAVSHDTCAAGTRSSTLSSARALP